jgi:hypothetical protein
VIDPLPFPGLGCKISCLALITPLMSILSSYTIWKSMVGFVYIYIGIHRIYLSDGG